MNAQRFLGAVTLAAIGVAPTALGQGMLAARSKDPGQDLAKFFGKNTAFSATAHVTTTDSTGKQLPSMEMQYAMLDGKIRTEIDMAKMQVANLPPEVIAQMKQMGMDRTVSVFVPDRKLAYMMYPSMKAYCEIDATQMTGKMETKEPKIAETELGKETIDGHPCVKSKIVATDEDGRKVESLVWKATDLKGFPIQAQMTTADQTITTKFTDINR